MHKLCDELVSLKYCGSRLNTKEGDDFKRKLLLLRYKLSIPSCPIIDPLRCVESLLSRFEMLVKLDNCASRMSKRINDEKNSARVTENYFISVPKFVLFQYQISLEDFLNDLSAMKFPLSNFYRTVHICTYLLSGNF